MICQKGFIAELSLKCWKGLKADQEFYVEEGCEDSPWRKYTIKKPIDFLRKFENEIFEKNIFAKNIRYKILENFRN